MAAMQIENGVIPTDIPPDDGDDTPQLDNGTLDYDPQFPGSTPEAPYGFKADGTAYKRRPRGSGGGPRTGVTRMPASDKSAEAAANVLARLNLLMGAGIELLGMPMTAGAIESANEQFKVMAYESLLTDPALCRKILGAGASSGKAGLVMAYVMVGASIVPAAKTEIQTARRNKREAEYDGD